MLPETGPFAIAGLFSHQSHQKAVTLHFCGFGSQDPDCVTSRLGPESLT